MTTAGSHVMSSSIATWIYEIGMGSVRLGYGLLGVIMGNWGEMPDN